VAYETQGFAIWITGLPASGKSRVTAALIDQLKKRGVDASVLESDVLRRSFSAKPGYDEQDRQYFYGSLAFIGQVLTQRGINVILDATANKRAYRDAARRRIPQFMEVHVDTPLEVCIQRDPKGIYSKGKSGEAQHVPGLQDVYEAPENPDLVIHGDRDTPEAGAARIVQLIESRGWLP